MTPRSTYFRSRRFAGVALLALAGLTCRDRSLTGPGLTAPAKLRVAPNVTAAPFGPLFTLGGVRVTLTPYPGAGEPAINRVATFTPGQTELSLDLTVQLSEPAERFVLRVAAAEAQAPHDTIFRSVDTITVTAGSDAPTPQPVALLYDGRDKDVASITVEPVDTTFRTTDNVQLRVVARRADGTVVDPSVVRVGYTLGDETNAQVSAAGVISARAPGVGFANMLVTVGTGNGVTGTTRITGRVPVAAVEVTSAGGATEPIAGTTLQLTGTVRGPTNVVLGDRPITWGTTNPARATVSATGLVTAGPDTGEVFITAAAEGVEAPRFRLRVRPVPVAAVRITLPSPLPVFEVGDTLALTAVAEGANGQPLTGRPVTWSTTTPAIVRVLDDGRVIALAPGAAQVTATAEGVAGNAALTVVQAAVASLTLTPDPVEVVRGGTAATTVSLVDKRGNAITGRAVAYRLTRPNVASVNPDGVITGLVADDTTSLIAEVEAKADTVRVRVLRRPLAALTVQPLTASLVVGETVTIVATTLDAQGQSNSDFPVTFQSLNPSVATVNATTGVVTAVAPGTATIRASAGPAGAELTADAAVTVRLRATGVRVTPREPPALTALGSETVLNAAAFAGDAPLPDARFTWESRTAAVADVSFSESGSSVIVTARGNGTAWIVATLTSDPTQKDSVLVTVQQRVAALSITPAEATRYLGTFLQYEVAALDARQQPVPSTVALPQIAWSTLSGGQVVAVDQSGRATMMALGSDSVIASVASTNARAAAFVTVAAAIRRIAVGTTPTTAPALGTRVVATAAAFDTLDAAMPGVAFTWSSDNPQVLRFDSVGAANGAAYYTALANGAARVIAVAQGQQGSAQVTVAQQLAQIRLDPANGLVVNVGGTGVAAASYFDANGQPMQLAQQPIFSIRNEQPAVPGTTVARVDPATGVVTGVAAGSAEVVATLNGITSNAVRVQVSGLAVVFGVPQVQVGTRTTVQVPVMLTGAPGAPVTLLVRALDPRLVELTGNAGGGQNGGVGLLFPRGSTQQMLTVTGLAAGTTRLIAQEAVCDDGCEPDPDPSIVPDTVDALVASAISIDRPIHVARGDSALARLILQDPAPQGGLTVGFTFTTAGIVDVVAARVPPTLPPGTPNVVTIPAGLLAVDIYVRGLANGATQITPVPQGTTTPGFAQTAVVTQGQLHLYGFNDYQTGDTVFVIGEGQHNSIYAESNVMTSSAPGDSLRVALTAADPRIAASAEPVVVVPPGLDYALFNLRGLARGRTTLTAAAQHSDVWQPATRAVRVTTPYLQLNDYSSSNETVLVGSVNHILGIYVSDSLGTPHARISPLAVRLRVETVSPAGGAPIAALDSADITLRSGNVFYTSYTGVRFLAPGTVRVIAEAPGEPNHRPDTVTYTVVAGKLEFHALDAERFPQPVASVSLPVGQVYEGLTVRAPQGVSQLPTLDIRRLPNAAGGPFASPEAPGLTLGSSGNTVNVTGITGLALGADRYEVSAPGFTPDTVTVNVVRGRLTTDGLPDSVQVGERDSFSLGTETGFRMAANVGVTVTSSGQGLAITGSPATLAAGDRSASPSPGIVANAAGTYQITFTPDNPNYDALVRTVVVIAPKLIGYVRGEGQGDRVDADTIGLGQMTSSTGDPTLGVRVPFDLLTSNVTVRVRSLDPEVALVGPGTTNDTTVTICPTCSEPEAGYVVRARTRGTARIELSAAGFEPDTIRVVVASGRFTANVFDPGDPADNIPDELVVGERGSVPVYLTDSLSLAAAVVSGNFYFGAMHDADSVTLRLSSSNPAVLQLSSQYVRVPRGAPSLTLGEVLIAAAPGVATFTIEDSATHASPALARYAPLSATVTVLGRALEVAGDELALGMRQRFGFVNPANGVLQGGLHVCQAGSGWGTTAPTQVRITSSEPRVAAVAPGFEVVTIPANGRCAAYDVVGQDSIGVVAIAVQAVDDAGAPIAGIRPDTLRLDVGRPRLYVSAGVQPVPVGETRTLSVMALDHEGTPHYAAEPVTVALASSDPSVATVQATVTLPTGTTSPAAQAVFTGQRVGEVRFTASDARTTPPAGPMDRRYASATSEAVQVTPPLLSILSPRNTTRTGVQQEDAGFVVRVANPVASPTTVQVSTNDPNVTVTPATVTIPAGSTVSSEFALVATTAAAAGTQFLVRAASDGFEPAAVVRTLAVGQLVVNNFVTTMRMGDSVLVRVDVNDPGGSMTRNVTAPQTVTVGQLPSHLVAYAAGTTTPTTTFTIPTGASSTSFYVKANDVGSGSFTVSSPNYETARSLSSTATAVWAYVGLGSGATDPANPTAGFQGCGVLITGRGYCWGDNSSGQLGLGSTTSPVVRPSPLPAQLPYSTNPRVSAGEIGSSHTCGISPTGQGFCAGRGAEGQLGPNSSGSTVAIDIGAHLWRFSYIAAGDRFTCGVTSTADSTTFCWGQGAPMGATASPNGNSMPQQVAGTGGANGLRFSFISAGLNSVCGITSPGDIYCWGDNSRGQLGNGPAYAGNQQIRQVPRQTPVVGAGPVIWRTVRVGAEFACGIAQTQLTPITAGKIYCWGRNDFGQAGQASTTNPVASPAQVLGQGTNVFYTMAAGTTHACASAITAGSTVPQGMRCWGRNNRGQLGNGASGVEVNATMVSVASSSGSIGSTGLPTGRFYLAIDAGAEATCAVAAIAATSTAGEAYCWGRNVNGQLALNTSTDSNFSQAVRIAEPIVP